MTVRLVAIVIACCLLSSTDSHAQQPVYLGSIPSDTINSLFGSVILPLGDQDDDGYADLLVWDIRDVAHVFSGGESPQQTPILRLSGIYKPLSRLGSIWDDCELAPRSHINRVTLADQHPGSVNGDCYLDIGVQILPSLGDRYLIYWGGPDMDSIPDEWFGVDSLDGWHYLVVLGDDLNGNGTPELITQHYKAFDARLVMYELGSSRDSVPDLVFGPDTSLGSCFLFGEGLAVGDFNADGSQDLVASWRSSSNTVNGAALVYWGGAQFDTTVDLVLRRPGEWTSGAEEFAHEVLCSPGDLNGDGIDDIVIGSSLAHDDTLTFVYFGGPEIDSIPDLFIYEPIDVVDAAGDVNHDGHPDVIASDPVRGIVSLYYGGPDFDSLYDFRIRRSDLPGLHFEFGMYCTGIGDYNGDGIDDFAFSGINNQTGTVYIYAGFDGSTGNGGGGGVVLPVDFQLYQNYPNPFNPTTTLAFQLPIKSHVEIDVFNVLGQRVTTLVSAELPAGSHSVVWDGTDTAGDEVASGVYMYRLTAGQVVLSRKMVLAR